MVGRALIFKMAMQLNLFKQNTLDRVLSDYFAMVLPLQPGRDDDYLVMTMPATEKLFTDALTERGLQARLYQAMLNSYAKGDFANFPAGSSIKSGSCCIIPLDKLQISQPALDTNGYKMLKISVGNTYGGRSEFIAELREKNAALYFHRSMKPDAIAEMLRPFVSDENKRKLYARYLTIKAAKLKP